MQDDAVPPAPSVESPDEDLSSAILARAKRYGEGILGAGGGVENTLVGGTVSSGAGEVARQSDAFAGSLQSLLTYRGAAPGDASPAPSRAAEMPPLRAVSTPDFAFEREFASPDQPPAEAEPTEGPAGETGTGSWVRRLESAWDILEARNLERDTAPDLESIGMPVEPVPEPPPPRGTGRRTRIQEAPGSVSLPGGRPAPPAQASSAPPGPATPPPSIQRTPAPEGDRPATPPQATREPRAIRPRSDPAASEPAPETVPAQAAAPAAPAALTLPPATPGRAGPEDRPAAGPPSPRPVAGAAPPRPPRPDRHR